MEGFEECLVATIQNYKCLYDKNTSSYRDKKAKENAWNEVSKITERPVQECQSKWKTLRERFARERRKLEQPSGSGACSSEPWIHFHSMLFLKDFVRPRKTRDNADKSIVVLEEDDDDDADAENIPPSLSEFTSSPPEPKRRKKEPFAELCKKFGEKLENLESKTTEDDNS